MQNDLTAPERLCMSALWVGSDIAQECARDLPSAQLHIHTLTHMLRGDWGRLCWSAA
jgi:hypothetical protein